MDLYEISKLLVEKGAKYDVKDMFSKTAKDYAKERGVKEIIELFK